MKNYNVYEKSAVQIHGGIFKMSTMKEKHTFVICAYKESAYLEECVKSLKEQKKESNIIMAVSYTHLTLPTSLAECRSRWSPYH